MKHLILILTVLILNACGDAKCEWAEKSTEECQESNLTEQTYFILQGSIVGAFQITVNGKYYDDIEDFYGEEIHDIQAKIAEAGYSGYSIDLDVRLGFSDLTRDMTVYVTSKGSRGYAARTQVSGDDTFSFELPTNAAGGTYQLRAVKRINIELTNLQDPSDVKMFCYNFSGIEESVTYKQEDKPVILNKFESKITTYECEARSSYDGLEIPMNSQN